MLKLLNDRRESERERTQLEKKVLEMIEIRWRTQDQKISDRERATINQLASEILERGEHTHRLIKILFLAANPSGTEPIDFIKELNAIEDEIDRCKFRDRFDIEKIFEMKPDELSRLLLKYDPQIVHFSGHGSEESQIILPNDTGNATYVDASAVARMFSIFKENIQCVVLNACYTKLQAEFISKYIDCVIGMAKAIGDEAAIKFAQGFYRGIGYGKDLETAFELGCTQISLEGLGEEYTPKILWKDDLPKKIILN